MHASNFARRKATFDISIIATMHATYNALKLAARLLLPMSFATCTLVDYIHLSVAINEQFTKQNGFEIQQFTAPHLLYQCRRCLAVGMREGPLSFQITTENGAKSVSGGQSDQPPVTRVTKMMINMTYRCPRLPSFRFHLLNNRYIHIHIMTDHSKVSVKAQL